MLQWQIRKVLRKSGKVKTVHENPHQNGVVERMNKTIMERARSIRIHAGLPKQFWADAVNTEYI